MWNPFLTRRHCEVVLLGKHPAWGDYMEVSSHASRPLARRMSRFCQDGFYDELRARAKPLGPQESAFVFECTESEMLFAIVMPSKDAVGRSLMPLMAVVWTEHVPLSNLFFSIAPKLQRFLERCCCSRSPGDVHAEYHLIENTYKKTLKHLASTSDEKQERMLALKASQLLQHEEILGSGLDSIRPWLHQPLHDTLMLPLFPAGGLPSIHAWAHLLLDLLPADRLPIVFIFGQRATSMQVRGSMDGMALASAMCGLGQRPVFAHQAAGFQSSPARRGALARVLRKLREGKAVTAEDIELNRQSRGTRS